MPDISPVNMGATPVGPAVSRNSVQPPTPRATPAPAPTDRLSSDRVELSDHARLLDRLRRLPDVRTEFVDSIRKEIAKGTYETPERLEGAIDNLIQDLLEPGSI